MKICMRKIGLIRPDFNPRNSSLNMDIDWSIEYTNTDRDIVNFDIILKSCGEFSLNFKIEGIVMLDLFEEFIQDDVSQIIFHQACNTFMDMISITRESVHILSEMECPVEYIPNTS